MNKQIIEIASWRIISELYRRYPHTFKVIETHPGGGLYDCLSLCDTGMRHIADFNRAGSFHVFNRFDKGGDIPDSFDIWHFMIHAEDPREVIESVSNMLGLPLPGRLPPSEPDTLVYRWIAAFLAHAVFGREEWKCQNGFHDTSGYGGGIQPFFKKFLNAKKRLEVTMSGDILSNPAYRFWFLTKNNKAVLCLETAGFVWRENGSIFDLPILYEKERKIWPLVLEIAGHLLP